MKIDFGRFAGNHPFWTALLVAVAVGVLVGIKVALVAPLGQALLAGFGFGAVLFLLTAVFAAVERSEATSPYRAAYSEWRMNNPVLAAVWPAAAVFVVVFVLETARGDRGAGRLFLAALLGGFILITRLLRDRHRDGE
jgi:hypothetical protein